MLAAANHTGLDWTCLSKVNTLSACEGELEVLRSLRGELEAEQYWGTSWVLLPRDNKDKVQHRQQISMSKTDPHNVGHLLIGKTHYYFNIRIFSFFLS